MSKSQEEVINSLKLKIKMDKQDQDLKDILNLIEELRQSVSNLGWEIDYNRHRY